MKKETLTVETNEHGTITYHNADGDFHNPNGPAVIYADGRKEHWINGELHNENGPAVIYSSGDKEHWVDGEFINEAKFQDVADSAIR